MKTPNATQIPLLQPIATRDGLLPNVWVMFFQKLVDVVNQADANGDLIEIMQLAHQLPTNAQQAQQGFDIQEIQSTFIQASTPMMHFAEIPPIQAVFLCPDVVWPLVEIHQECSAALPVVTPPSSEIIHD